jgi:hypothetical protein
MSTTIAGHLSSQEAWLLRATVNYYLATQSGSGVPSTPFRFLANFDGTNNNKADVPLSGLFSQGYAK